VTITILKKNPKKIRIRILVSAIKLAGFATFTNSEQRVK